MPRINNRISIGGIGSVSRSLGGADPRLRRNTTQLGVTDVVTGGPMRIDKNARLVLKKAEMIEYTPEVDATAVVINALIRSLKTSGIMEG